VAVYEELDAQGWVQTRPNKGTFIVGKIDTRPQKIHPARENQLAHYPKVTGFSFKKSNLLDNPF
jgi:GntR family transcriptional regulator/MocR family aminotransferase